MKSYIYINHGKAKRPTSFIILSGLLFFVFSFAYPVYTSSQVFEFRRIAAGADTSEIYINCYWYDDNDIKWGGVFHSIDNGKTLSVQYKNNWLTSFVHGEIFGDSLSGTAYLMPGPYVSHDFGQTWVYKPTPITNYFEGTGGCFKGEVYLAGVVSSAYNALFHGLYFGDSLFLMNTEMDSLSCTEAGSLPGELYAIQWPYYGPYSDTLGLALSIDYGQTFTINYIDTSIVSYLYKHTLAHGPDTGELYIAAIGQTNQYKILHSMDYGHTFSLQYMTPPISDWYDFSFVAGRAPGTFYILKTGLCSSIPLHNCIEIHYSADYGQTYTIYYHEIDSTYTGISPPRSREKSLISYPNPVSDQLNVTWGRHSTSSELQLYDLTGRLQLTKRITTGNDKTLVDVSSLKPGIYLLKVTDRERVIGVEKVVVE